MRPSRPSARNALNSWTFFARKPGSFKPARMSCSYRASQGMPAVLERWSKRSNTCSKVWRGGEGGCECQGGYINSGRSRGVIYLYEPREVTWSSLQFIVTKRG